MRTTLAALAGAGAALAAYTPDSYDSPPPAYGGDASSSSSSPAGPSSYASPTTSSAAPSGTPDMPACWTSCFTEAGVTSPADTCGDEDLTECIEDSCSDEEADLYKTWLDGECGTASTSSAPAGPTGSTSLSHGPSGYASSSSLSGYPHGPSSYPVGPSSYPVGPSGYVPSSSGMPGGYGNCTTTYSSVCTETETKIYRDTTEYEATTITHIFTTSLPSGSCSGALYPITTSSSVPYSPVTTSDVPVYPGGNGGYPGDGGLTTVTDVETIYTTVCPGTSTTVSDGETITSTYDTTSVVTTTYKTTVTVTPSSPASPSGPSCWDACFSENGVTSKEGACVPAVGSCIDSTCSADEAASFDAWAASFCVAGTSSSPASPATTSASVTTSSTPAPTGPSCWDSCFTENGVTSKEEACVPAVGSCIDTKCSEQESADFDAWAVSFCVEESTSSTPVSPATTSAAVTSPSGPAPSGSSCWDSCFSQNGVTSKEGACVPAVGECIDTTCSEQESADFDAWAVSFCVEDGELPTEPAGGIPTEYTSIKPVSKPFTYGEWTSYYTDFETVTLTSYVTAPATETGAVPTGGYGGSDGGYGGSDGGDGSMTTATQTYDTTITTAYTTVCPAEETDGITTSTITTTSTIHLTFTVTTSCEATPTSSSVGGGEQPPYPTPTDSYSKPSGYPTGVYPTGGYGSGSVSMTSSYAAGPTGSPEQPPIADCWAKCFAENEITSESALCGNIHVETCIKAECPIESYNAYEGWLDDYCGVASTSSGVVGPTGSGYPQPTGSEYPHPTGGYPHPTGSGSPQPSGTSAPSGTISTSSTCSLPTPTESCKRCDGQPGDDKFCGLDINTNIYEEGNAPITCNTVEYDWEITTGLVSPDGVERMAVLVNGQSPGPMLEANWGDEIIVRVKNSMPASDLNGTTIHWHGIHQKGTNEYDGVPSITQCPIAPGETYVYRFRATQYGSSWYHSHFALQAYDGLFGPMVIHGPVQEGYEYDGEEFVSLQDWRHAPLTEIYHNLELVSNNQRSAPTLDTGLINGKNTFNGAGERWSMTVTKGKTYRLRVLNAAVQSTFKFYIDGHSFKVIAADFVPIEPYETNIININNGQRYDVIFTADQPSGNYWMRSDVQAPCSPVTNGLDIKAIVHYDDAPEGEPTSTAYQYQPECIDESPENLKPIVPWNAGAASGEINKDVLIQPNGGNPNLFKWTLSGTAFFSQWSDPTLQSIYEDGTVPTYSGDLAIREDNLGEWIYVIIDSVIPLPHPIHLHGHDFLVLGQGLGPYDASTAQLNLNNPPRRDTAIMPHQVGQGAVGGYLVVAFYTDNPGVWLMHCHIGWHNAMGFALQIIEGLEDIKDTVEYECQMNDTCESWHAYSEKYGLETTDSGI